MSVKEKLIEMRKLLDATVDNGKAPPLEVLTDNQRKLAAFAIGTNAALIQFVTEGIIPAEEQGHFMMHLQDFAARLYAGEDILFPDVQQVDLNTGTEPVQQTFNVDSRLGSVYLAAAELGLKEGRVPKPSEGKEDHHVNKRLN